MVFESLPVELIADILGELDLESLIRVSYLSRRLHQISSDSSLNPWRKPILYNLQNDLYEVCLSNLSLRSIVPRQNWIEILSMARPDFLLFETTVPHMKETEWEECFRRRFLPGWCKWKKDGKWKEVFLKTLYRVWHRSNSFCTTDEAWTKYVVLNRNGSTNELDASSRNYNPIAIFDNMKLQSNIAHLETRIRLLVRFVDVRILAFGVLNKPKSDFTINHNARALLHPPGLVSMDVDYSLYYKAGNSVKTSHRAYERLQYPSPASSHANYPFYTPGGGDKRWLGSDQLEEEGMSWVGGLLLTAQLIGPRTHEISGDNPTLQDLDLVVGPGRRQFASFSWKDLLSIAPWMEERITKVIDGPGLGN